MRMSDFVVRDAIVPGLAAILAFVLFAASRTVRKDVAKLHAWMDAALERPTPPEAR